MSSFLINAVKFLFLGCLFVFGSGFLYANSFDSNRVYYNKNEQIKISNCFSTGWCSVEGTDFFVKKSKIQKNSSDFSNSYIVKAEGLTYKYLNNQSLRANTMLWDYISQKVLFYPKRVVQDFENNFTRIDIVKKYFNRGVRLSRPSISNSFSSPKKRPASKKRPFFNVKEEVLLDDEEPQKQEKQLNSEISPKKVASSLLSKSKKVQKGNSKYKYKEVYHSIHDPKSKYFLTISLDTSYFNIINQIDEALLIDDALKRTGSGFQASIGSTYSKDVFTTFNFAYTSLKSGVDVYNAFLTANYLFDGISYNPYVGLLAGYSRIEWKTYPFLAANLESGTLDSTTILSGFQVGVTDKISNGVFLFARYQFMILNGELQHESEGDLDFNHRHNLSVGVHYAF